ncbi:hypothetical protein [Clostridium cochlearium]|uniref:hypothetical protein n=1 Tax=Clostridium cochlearium TaxID=1494 RepID=UPI00214A0B5E|nr:hypothetical protein [Clostridium cochlearium]MCR1970920.1 hypothetical protein [Clostridium cochlearium]
MWKNIKKLKESQEKIQYEKDEKIINIKNKYNRKKETILENAFKAILNPFEGE